MTNQRISATSGKAIYLAAMAFLLFLGLWGWADSGFLLGFAPYAFVALICALQFFRPLASLWWLVFVGFAGASAFYVWVLASDVWSLLAGGATRALSDLSDSLAFVIFLLAALGITVGLFRVRPRTTQPGAT